MERITVELLSSLATVALAILAVVIFIYYGAGALFYVIVAVALIVGFYNAWLLSKSEAGAPARPAPFGQAAQKKVVNLHAAKAGRAKARKTGGTKA